MKKQLLPFIVSAMLGASGIGYAQQTGTTPEGFKYQASLRNIQGEVIADKLVSIRISILSKGSNLKGGNTEQVYSETHTVSTNKLGMVSFEIGNGKNETGDFSAINWGSTEHYVQIEMDEAGGDNYKLLGTSQLMAVPYSLHAKMASDVMPGSITIQNEIAARKEADEVLQSQINIIRQIVENANPGKGSNEATLGVAQDLQALENRYEADSAAKNIRINNNLTRFTNDSAAKQIQITNNLTRFKNDSVALRNLIAAEVSRAQAAEAELQTNLDTEAADRVTDVNNEESRATTAEADLQTQINTLNSSTNASVATETARAQAAETELANGLAAEVARATAAETTLDAKVTTEKSRAEGIEGGLRNDLTAETSRATAAEQTNAAAITTEATTARAAETELAEDIAAAATNAAAATAGVQSNLDAEIARASVAEQENAAAIAAEATAARSAEAGLDSRVDALEATDAQQASTNANQAATNAALQSSIDAEAATARTAEQANATAITNETDRATTAETTLDGKITTEKNRAEGAEAGLDARVDVLEAADVAQSTINAELQSQITAEVNRSTGVDADQATTNANQAANNALQAADIAANANAITAETTRATIVENGLRTDVNTATSVNNAQATEITANVTAITTETNRATTAEAALSTTAATKWGNAGNTGTNASTNFIGTTDNVDLVAKTNNTERLRIKSSGQVEINTTSGSLLLPRLNDGQRDALTPTPGMTIYNTTSKKFQGFSNINAGGEALDQSSTGTFNAGPIIGENGQSFTAGATGNLTKIGLNVSRVNTPGTYTFRLKTGSSISATTVYTQTITISSAGDQTFPVTGTVYLTSGTLYSMWFEPINGSNANVWYSINNPYTNGNMFRWIPTYSDLSNQYDIAFKTFITPAGNWQDLPGASVAEVTTATSALQSQITAEVTRATGIENGLRTDVNAAIVTNNSQATAITNLQNQVGSGTVDDRIATAAAAVWSKAGNSASASDFIGTTNAADLVVKTNNTERLRVTSAGQVNVTGGVKINTTTAGLIMPRLTTAQRNALTPEAGTTIYNVTTEKFQGYKGTPGTEIIDQENTTWGGTSYGASMGQAFKAEMTGSLTAIALDCTAGNFTLKIFNGAGIGGTLLATQTITIPSGSGIRYIDLSTPVNVTNGNIYTFEVIGGINTFQSTANPYPFGDRYYNGSVTTGWDLVFRTYVTPASTAGWVDLH